MSLVQEKTTPVTPAKPQAKGARALVMIPAGKRYDHDKVMIYDQPREAYLRSYFNVGDMMVYDSTLRLLDFADIDVLRIRNPTEADIDRYNSIFDYVFLRGSNFIHEQMDWESAAFVLERLKIPVIAVGVGAQAESRRKIILPEESKRIWAMISERCHSIGVRGSYTAEVLADNGIQNTEIVGCPSLFRQRKRMMTLRRRPAADVHKVAFSLRRETSKHYSKDMAAFTSRQRDFMLRLARDLDLTISIHGEPEEKAFFDKDDEGMAAAILRLRRDGWLTAETEQEILALYRDRLFLADRVSSYDEMIAQFDFAIGYRVHGVLPALAAGIPGRLVSYDSRSSELAETFSIPTGLDEELLAAPYEEIFDPALFNTFLSRFTANYDRMKGHLDRNGIANRM